MDVFDLVAKLTLDDDEYRNKLGQDKAHAASFGDALKKGVGVAGKAVMASVAVAGAAAVSIGKKALDAYGEFEQLIGGTELLFGDAFNTVAENAKNAYATVQMSQNDYLKQANGFATGLKTALGGNEQAAADLAHKIITAEADVVAATGNTQEAVQNAFNGIMKGNFTMLDNLQLGITPTKEGFQEVIDKVNAWNEAQGNATKYQMGNLADMQSALVDYIDMVGVAGYAQAEAANTIQGSIAATKAAWSNLITGLADENADLDQLIDNFIDSALKAADNILPRVQKIMDGIGKLISKGLNKVLPVITKLIADNLPQIVSAGIQILIALITGIIQGLPQLIAAIPEILAAIVDAFAENWPALKEAGIQLMIMIAEGVAEGLTRIGEMMVNVGNSINEWIRSAWESIKQAAAEKWAEITEAISGKIEEIRSKLSEWVSAAGEKAQEFGQAIHDGIQSLLTEIGQWIEENLIQPARDKISEFFDIGTQAVENIKSGFQSAWGGLRSWVSSAWNGIKSLFVVSASDVQLPSGRGSAIGLDYVPFNSFPAILHKGEAVLTAREADEWRRGNSNNNGGVVINQYLETVPQTPVEVAAATAAFFEQARWAVA